AGPADPPAEHRAADVNADVDADGPAAHEVTLQVRLPAPGGTAEHERTADDERTAEHERTADDEPEGERVTDKGLPKRTPRIVDTGAPRAERTSGVNAEELRRRLGGFHQGSQEGRRDAEAEISGAEEAASGTGDTVEEAHS
ncbi:histidine kinase, partial [Streptomyces sp. Act-28]